jgi:tetratricopeptide (TPR) repeat protein
VSDNQAAVESYEKAIALNEASGGKFASPQINLSAYYYRTGDGAKAMEYADKAIALEPQSDRAWFQKAKAEERAGNLDSAVQALNQAISFNGRASSYYYVLAGLYRRQGKVEESKKALDSFAKLDRESNELEKMRREASHPAAKTPARGQRD